MKIKNKIIFVFALIVLGSVSCVDLDLLPRSTLSPELYFANATQLQDYVAGLYREGNSQVFPVHLSFGNAGYGSFGADVDTDNQASKTTNNRWYGQWHVGSTGGAWSFMRIYRINYFFDVVLPKLEEESISGSQRDIDQALGEVYFFRAWEYFEKIMALGDFPIITELLTNDQDVLVAASVRQPMNEVARFVLADLGRAIALLNTNSTFRINERAAQHLKSRVALYMGTWLKYFADTPFVPNGPGWPGAATHPNYQFPAGSIEDESRWFLQQAIDAAKIVADATPLVPNNGVVRMQASDPHNLYFTMFGDADLDSYREVVFYKRQTFELGDKHRVPGSARGGTTRSGVTRQLVDNFLMANGLPIYAPGSGYHGDDFISDVRKDRDGRLNLFLKEPGQPNLLDNVEFATFDEGISSLIEQFPSLTLGDNARNYSTGYTLRKGGSYDGRHGMANVGGFTSSIIFRGAEAYLNYIEAYYELNGYLNATAQEYWTAIRRRARVNEDFNITIDATDMDIEKENDWGAWSAGEVLSSKMLYNIRRERRSELMAEALRMMDLRRWRALCQMLPEKGDAAQWHPEGFKLWGPMRDEPTAPWNDGRQPRLSHGVATANVSPPSSSIYLRSNQFSPTSVSFLGGVPRGYTWRMAYYLNPIAIVHFQVATPDGESIDQSSIYQNQYMPIQTDAPPIR